MRIPATIFRQYDIRGLVETELTPDLARAVGLSYARITLEGMKDAADAGERGGFAGGGNQNGQHGSDTGAGRRPVVVLGQDNRPSSPALARALGEGLTQGGLDVLDLGVVPTPVTWWAEKTLGVDGALQVTGSHNPPEWNGIKITRHGRSVYGEGVQAIRRRIEDGEPGPLPEIAWGKVKDHPVLDRYVEDVGGRFDLGGRTRVVIDCGNGTGSVVAERLLRRAGAEVIPLFCESDGTFPNHHPDPTVDENMVDLSRLVLEHQAHVGVGFDGDADRIGAVDDRGRIVRGDILLLLYGLDLLRRRGPGQLLVFDVKCSQVLPEVYEAAGGKALMWKTGHSLMKEKMHETGAPLAGELSGHICFADEYLGIDDALYDALRLLELLDDGGPPLSERVDALPAYVSTPEIRIEIPEERKAGVVDRAVAHFAARHEVIDVDGVRILFGDGWGLLRASNTQPVLVARFEARTEERLQEIRTQVEDWLRGEGVHV
jgi:phosphomannomutase / phosphoglucomutase